MLLLLIAPSCPTLSTPWTAARQASLSVTISQSLLKLMSTELVMPSSHHILCRPLLLPPFIASSIRVFSNESILCISWPKYWSFNFSITPSKEYSGLISFRIDWFDLLAVQGVSKVHKLLPFLKVLCEKAMTPHSSTLAWKIPWMEEPGRLQSMGSLRVGHD